MGLLDIGAGDDGAVLQHILQVHQIAVVHMLGKIVRVVEVDQTLLVCLDDIRSQQQAVGQVFGDLTGHIVPLYAVDSGVFVGVLLLDLLVLALDQAEDALVCGVGLTLQALHITVGDIVAGNVVGPDVHELVLHHILDLLHVYSPVQRLALVRNIRSDLGDLVPGQAVLFAHRLAGFAHCCDDLGNVKRHFGPVALDDLHRNSSIWSAVSVLF